MRPMCWASSNQGLAANSKLSTPASRAAMAGWYRACLSAGENKEIESK